MAVYIGSYTCVRTMLYTTYMFRIGAAESRRFYLLTYDGADINYEWTEYEGAGHDERKFRLDNVPPPRPCGPLETHDGGFLESGPWFSASVGPENFPTRRRTASLIAELIPLRSPPSALILTSAPPRRTLDSSWPFLVGRQTRWR